MTEVPKATTTRVIIAGLVAVALGLAAAWLVFPLIPREVSREEFLTQVRQRQLKTVTICPLDHQAMAGYGDPGAIRTELARDDPTFPTELRASGVEVVFDTSDSLTP